MTRPWFIAFFFGLPMALLLAACSAALPTAVSVLASPAPVATANYSPAGARSASPITLAEVIDLPTTAPPGRGWLVIHGTGDVNLDPAYVEGLALHGHEHAWSGLDRLFLSDDLTIVNLECAPSSLGNAEPKDYTFGCDPAALPLMQAAGVEVANLANNHSQDFGKEAMLDGRANLVEAGIAPVGVGASRAEANQPAFFEVAGWRVAVLGFGGVFPHDGWAATTTRPGMADGDDVEAMTEAVRNADAFADLAVVAIHWGVEFDTEPRVDDVERAEAMVEAGADVIFGHHSHRLNPLGEVDGKPVAWGLGNFVWLTFSGPGATTAVARVVISPSGAITSCLIPAHIESSGHPVLVGIPPCGAR